jgi:hypothetical protein
LHDIAAGASEIRPRLIVPVDDLGLIRDVFPVPRIRFWWPILFAFDGSA